MVIGLRNTDKESAPEPSSSRVVVDPYPPTNTKPELVSVLVWPRLLIMVCHWLLGQLIFTSFNGGCFCFQLPSGLTCYIKYLLLGSILDSQAGSCHHRGLRLSCRPPGRQCAQTLGMGEVGACRSLTRHDWTPWQKSEPHGSASVQKSSLESKAQQIHPPQPIIQYLRQQPPYENLPLQIREKEKKIEETFLWGER